MDETGNLPIRTEGLPVLAALVVIAIAVVFYYTYIDMKLYIWVSLIILPLLGVSLLRIIPEYWDRSNYERDLKIKGRTFRNPLIMPNDIDELKKILNKTQEAGSNKFVYVKLNNNLMYSIRYSYLYENFYIRGLNYKNEGSSKTIEKVIAYLNQESNKPALQTS